MDYWIVASISALAISAATTIVTYINTKKKKEKDLSMENKLVSIEELVLSKDNDKKALNDEKDASNKLRDNIIFSTLMKSNNPGFSDSYIYYNTLANQKTKDTSVDMLSDYYLEYILKRQDDKKLKDISKKVDEILYFTKEYKLFYDAYSKQNDVSSGEQDVKKIDKQELNTGGSDLGEFSSLLEKYNNQRDQDIKQVIYNIKHLLGTPLSGIKANLAILTKNNDAVYSADINPRLESISNAVEMIESSINTLLEYETLDDSGSIKKVLSRCAKVAALTSTKKINIQIDSIPDDLTFSKTIADALTLCTQCIVENAAIYSPDNGEIKIDYKKQGIIHELHISNYGDPIPEEIGEKIFTEHFTTREEGNGIGLYLVKKTVTDILHGDVRYENVLDDEHSKVDFIISFEV